MTEQKKPRLGCLWAVILVQGFVLIVLLFAVLGATAFHHALANWESTVEMGEDEFPPFTEVWSSGQGETKVIRIPIKGEIMMEDGETSLFSSGQGTAANALASIRRAIGDPSVSGIILDIDSGGGGITACDVIYHALEEFKASADKRVVVAVFGDVAASGAYYVAAAADSIIGRPTTLTGSIGVLMQSINFQDLARKVGVRDVTIKSGQNKDILNPFQDLTEEQKQMLQEVVDELHDRFVRIVAENRKLDEADVRAFADGRVFTARKALDLGLLDDIGHWETAVDKAVELLGVEEVKIYRYEREFSFSELLRARTGVDGITAMMKAMPRTRFLYLWQP